MNLKRAATVMGKALLVIAVIMVVSAISARVMGGKSETAPQEKAIVIREEMTIAQFGAENNLEKEVLKHVFGLTGQEGLKKRITDTGLTKEQIADAVRKERALGQEYESKNWFLIPAKFALWFLFLGAVFVALRKGKITGRLRSVLYLAAAILFGAILGSDPSPMGTVKDAVVLLGTKGVIFPPRIVAMSVFLAIVVVANKFICSWGCQLGTLQDLLFRIGNDRKEGKGRRAYPKYKIPFVVSNSIRIGVFAVFSFVAFAWGIDLIKPVDPFKFYRPALLGFGGLAFVFAILAASLFVYRPWCHLFCPFGLVGWLFEKVSIFKIKVNRDTCIECGTCAKSCPSTVMGAILEGGRTIPDCFSCGTCMEVCPTKSISFQAGKRTGRGESQKLRNTQRQ